MQQCFGSGLIESESGSNPNPGFDDQKLTKKFVAGKKMLWIKKVAIYLSLRLCKGRPGYRRSLQPSKENIQHFKTWNFSTFFSIFVGHFCPPGSGSTDLIKSRSNPDPEHWHSATNKRSNLKCVIPVLPDEFFFIREHLTSSCIRHCGNPENEKIYSMS